MGLNTIAPDALMTCPLDDAHRILKSRMQFHLVRCLKNHKLDKKIRCPWNPLHIVDKFEYEDHFSRKCEDLCNAMGSEILSEIDVHRDVASIPVNATNLVLPRGEEDWDADTRPVATYDPLKKIDSMPILRQSHGLSKAKRKEFIQQERRRHQLLEDILPIDIKARPKQGENIDAPKSCRPPRNQQIAISADPSMIEELNSSRYSNDSENFVKLPAKPRPPRSQSPALAYETIYDPRFSYVSDDEPKNLTLFDAAFDDLSDYDARSCISSALSRKLKKLPVDRPKKSFAAVASVGRRETNNSEIVKPREIDLQDEAANFPAILSTSIVDDESFDQLSQRFASLTHIEKSIEEEKAAISRKLSEYRKKSFNSESSGGGGVTNLANEKYSIDANVRATIARNVEPRVKSQNDFTNVNPKCAANFGISKKPENPPIKGTGRGIVVDLEFFKKSGPVGNRRNHDNTKENDNSLIMPGNSMKNADSTKKMAREEIGSVYGYEIDD